MLSEYPRSKSKNVHNRPEYYGTRVQDRVDDHIVDYVVEGPLIHVPSYACLQIMHMRGTKL